MTNGSWGWGGAVGGIALAAGVAFAGVTVGQSLIEMRRADRLVTVKGLSETEVTADIANWRIPYRGQGDDSRAALKEAESARVAIRAFAGRGGMPEDTISDEPYSLRLERYYVNNAEGGQDERIRYVAVGAVRIRSDKVAEVAALASKTQELLDAGVLLGDSDYAEAARPQYLFTGLNAIKPQILKEATEAARASAQQFAADSGSRVGTIASADQGVIQILPRDGAYDESLERDKIVRVVSTIRYYLTDE